MVVPIQPPTPARGRDGNAPEVKALTFSFLPLTDAAPIIVAHAKGWFRAHDIESTLQVIEELGASDPAPVESPETFADGHDLDPESPADYVQSFECKHLVG